MYTYLLWLSVCLINVLPRCARGRRASATVATNTHTHTPLSGTNLYMNNNVYTPYCVRVCVCVCVRPCYNTIPKVYRVGGNRSQTPLSNRRRSLSIDPFGPDVTERHTILSPAGGALRKFSFLSIMFCFGRPWVCGRFERIVRTRAVPDQDFVGPGA